MGSRGVHFAIDDKMADRLLTAQDDDDVAALIEEIEEGSAHGGHCGTDKAWDAIHRSLTDGRLGYDNGEYPLNAAVLGGRQLYEADDYIVSLLTPTQVHDVAEAVAAITEDRLRAGYNTIDPADYGPIFGPEDFAYTWQNFTDLATFFGRAAQSDAHVIFTVDQ